MPSPPLLHNLHCCWGSRAGLLVQAGEGWVGLSSWGGKRGGTSSWRPPSWLGGHPARTAPTTPSRAFTTPAAPAVLHSLLTVHRCTRPREGERGGQRRARGWAPSRASCCSGGKTPPRGAYLHPMTQGCLPARTRPFAVRASAGCVERRHGPRPSSRAGAAAVRQCCAGSGRGCVPTHRSGGMRALVAGEASHRRRRRAHRHAPATHAPTHAPPPHPTVCARAVCPKYTIQDGDTLYSLAQSMG